jgi:group I intron endonuclease
MKRKPWVKTGIYCIECVEDKKRYIGSAVHIRHRWRGHIRLLNLHKHHSRHLQNAWCKYGSNSFTFKIIEECSEEVLREREGYYMDHYNTKDPSYGFNTLDPQICLPSNEREFYICDPMGCLHTGINISKFARENNLNISTLIGLINGNSRAKTYKGWRLPDTIIQQKSIQSPEGVVYSLDYMKHTQFCKQHNLTLTGLSSILNHKQKTHRGWKLA